MSTFLGLTLDAWNTIGTWFSAASTTTLAVAALWLAMRDKRAILKVKADRRVYLLDAASRPFSVATDVAGDLGLKGADVIEISATNIGHRGVVVTGTYWRVPWVFRKKSLKAAIYQTSPVNAFSNELPWHLADGQSSHHVHVVEDFKKLNAEQWKRLADGLRWKWAAVRCMKVGVTTTVGRNIERRISAEMVKLIREIIESNAPVAGQ